MNLNYEENCVMTAPGLVIKGGGSPTVKFVNTIYSKANGLVGTPKGAADCPNLATSIGEGPNSPVITNIPAKHARYFTLLTTIDPTTSVQTLSWVHGPDFSELTDIGRTQYINPGDSHKAIVGYVGIINGSAADFIPGTTALDAGGIAVIYQDAFGFTGA